jgi:hypothetical protein
MSATFSQEAGRSEIHFLCKDYKGRAFGFFNERWSINKLLFKLKSNKWERGNKEKDPQESCRSLLKCG